MVETQQMFILFFSILYGIMLNSVIGLRAFPLASAFAFKDYMGQNDQDKPIWEKGYRSFKRFVLSFVLLNILPFIYFAVAFQFIEKIIGNLPSANLFFTIVQVVFIGFLSLGVFAFYRFFIGLAILKHKKNYVFYTEIEYEKHIEKRHVYPSSCHLILVGFVYLIPWLVMILTSLICPLFCN